MNYSIKKIISKTVLAGIIISLLPMSIPAKAMKKPAKISRHTIDKKIAKLKKIIKKINQLKILVPTATLLAGGVGAILTPLLIPLYLLILENALFTAGSISISALVFGLILSGNIFTRTGAKSIVIGTLGKLSATDFLISIAGVQNLERIENQNPGTLSTEQLEIVAQFKNSIKGPILEGIIKGLKVRETSRILAKTAINKNEQFFKDKFGNEEYATKVVKKYLISKWKSHNLTNALNNALPKYNLKINKQKTIRDKYSMWKEPAKYHFYNAKLIGLKLNPLFLTLKVKAKLQANYVEKLEIKYGFKNKLKNAVNAFIQQADAIAAEFKKPLKRRAKIK